MAPFRADGRPVPGAALTIYWPDPPREEGSQSGARLSMKMATIYKKRIARLKRKTRQYA